MGPTFLEIRWLLIAQLLEFTRESARYSLMAVPH